MKKLYDMQGQVIGWATTGDVNGDRKEKLEWWLDMAIKMEQRSSWLLVDKAMKKALLLEEEIKRYGY